MTVNNIAPETWREWSKMYKEKDKGEKRRARKLRKEAGQWTDFWNGSQADRLFTSGETGRWNIM